MVRVARGLIVNRIAAGISSLRNRLCKLTVSTQRVNHLAVFGLAGSHEILSSTSVRRIQSLRSLRHSCNSFTNRERTRCRAFVFTLTDNCRFGIITYIDIVRISDRIVSTRQRHTARKHDRSNGGFLLLTGVDDASLGHNHCNGSALNARASLELGSHFDVQVGVLRHCYRIGRRPAGVVARCRSDFQFCAVNDVNSSSGRLHRTTVERCHSLQVVNGDVVTVSRISRQCAYSVAYRISHRTAIRGSNGDIHLLLCPCRHGCQHQQGHCG